MMSVPIFISRYLANAHAGTPGCWRKYNGNLSARNLLFEWELRALGASSKQVISGLNWNGKHVLTRIFFCKNVFHHLSKCVILNAE
jgi:hypothetical protein